MLTQQQSIAFSGNIPVNYDSYLGPMFFEPYALDMANRISKLSPSALLELASGTGRLTKLLPAVCAKNASIIASDLNPAMINFGKKEVKNDAIKWMEIDAVSLPFDDNSFDCVVVQFGVMFYSDRGKAFKEAWRVLKPGGVFIFNCWDEINNNPFALITNQTLKHFFPIDTPAFYNVPFSYYDEKIITKDLNESGFKNIKIELTKLTGHSQSAANAAMGLIHGNPVVTAIEDRDATKLPVITSYIENEIAKQYGKDSIRVPLQARVVAAVKN